ncbi:MAG: Rrf2 family transcriptional regulator [Ignavibacteriae bacterium]|nr:Rrf2 family transcriptional regulator [Ignavibacteriota bacterium]NOG97680.1 Rrf2 family transcriptional regulator [Ignavibacteriota bacterium]
MKFSAQEEYGLRCLIRVAKLQHLKKGLTIPEISQSEGISQHNTAKILRLLRIGGFLESERGQLGGYKLSRKPENIFIKDVLDSLGGRLYDETFCESHSGITNICTNSIDCSVRSVWKMIQQAVDDVISNLTLNDLLGAEISIFQDNFSNVFQNPSAE